MSIPHRIKMSNLINWRRRVNHLMSLNDRKCFECESTSLVEIHHQQIIGGMLVPLCRYCRRQAENEIKHPTRPKQEYEPSKDKFSDNWRESSHAPQRADQRSDEPLLERYQGNIFQAQKDRRRFSGDGETGVVF